MKKTFRLICMLLLVVSGVLALLAVYAITPSKTFLIAGCFFSALFAASLFLGARFNANKFIFLLLGLLPIALVLLLNQNFRVFGYHGWHQGMIAYQLLENGIPPSNPLLAGAPLLYAWGYPLFMAGFSKVANITPFSAAAIISVLALGVLLILTFKISRIFTTDRIANLFSVVGALYAFTFTQGGSGNPFQLLLKRIVSFNFDEGRATPIVQKFNGDTACHIGITFFALYLYSLLKIFSKKSSVSGAYFGFFVSILGVGFFYPFLLPAVISGTLLICLFVGIQSKGACLRRPGVIVAILCVALLALFPYLSSLYSVKAEIARLRVTFSAFHLFRNAMILVITILPMLLVILLSRERLLKIVRERVVEVAIMALTIVNGLGLFLFLTAPVNCEYKFLSLAIYGIGILGGVSLWEFYDKSRVKAFLLITLFMIPTGLTFASTCFGWRVPVEPFREEGRYLIHKDNNEAQLYEWIKGNTAQNDVFIDSKPAIPVFAQRQLYIGFDQSNKYDMYLEAILGTIEGHDSKILERRRRIVENLFSATAQLDDVALSKQAGEFPEQVNVFIVARNDFFRNKFADSNMTKKVFENDKIALFGIVNCKTNSMVEK